MIKTLQSLLVFFGLTLSCFTYATSALTEHAMSVSQSMSAFYMYSLSDGDSRYLAEYQTQLEQAEQHLLAFEKENASVANEFKSQWSKIRPELKYEFIDGAGYIIPVVVRNQFRAYLSSVYKKIDSSVRSRTNLADQLARVALDIEVVTARFFDISSALYGTMSISNTDPVDPVKMAARLKGKLKRLQRISMADSIKKDLRLVSRKWEFIEKSVINYKGEAAYLLVYYNKRQISKLLNKNTNFLAGN